MLGVVTTPGNDGTAGEVGSPGEAGLSGFKGTAVAPELYGPQGTVSLLTIGPKTLPKASKGAAYHSRLSVSGGKSGYVWVFYGLPPGMHADGDVLGGTPTAKGSFSVVVFVTDAAKHVGCHSYTLVVK
jgi:hypothetical protein